MSPIPLSNFRIAIKALLILLIGSPLLARPTLIEALDIDPANPPLTAAFLPRPPHITSENAPDYEYGYAVAVQGDTAFVSAPVIADLGSTKPGEVFVYRRSGDAWTIVQTLSPPDVTGWMRFGESLDISADGSVLVVGSNDEQQDAATAVTSGAYIFLKQPLTGRYEFHQKLIPAGGVFNQYTGSAVAVSGDWILFGAPRTMEYGTRPFGYRNGSAYFFKRESHGRWVEKQKVLPANDTDQAHFSTRLAIEGGNACVATRRAGQSGKDSGVLYFYHLDPVTDSWIQEATFEDPNSPEDYGHEFGNSMAFSGSRLLASYEYSEREVGHTFSFERVGDTWVQQATITSFPGDSSSIHKTTSSYAGRFVAQSGDLFVCSGFDDGGNAAVLGEILRFEGGAWQSKVILGDILAEAILPAEVKDPLDVSNYDSSIFAIDTDGASVVFKFAPRSNLDATRVELVAVISAEPADALSRVRPLITYEDADPNSPADAAFAFLHLLYEEQSPGQFITRHDDFETLYTQAHRDRADEAESLLRFAYPSATGSTAREMERSFLDLAYGRAAAQLIRSKNAVVGLDEDRLLDNSGQFIETEINVLQSALEEAAAGINFYLELLQDPLGVPPVSSDRAGRVIFARHVPARTLVSVVDSSELLSGYKDLVLLYDLLLQYAGTAAELAHLLTARDAPGDASAVRNLIGSTQRLVFEQRNLLDSLFNSATLTPSLREALGLNRLSASIDVALNELSAFQQNLNGTINLLGYEPDFLMLIRNQGGHFDSFDSFEAILLGSASPLAAAVDRRQQAINAISNYGDNQDALEAEFSLLVGNSTSAIIPRLTEIVGVPYSNPPTPAYQNPRDNEGSEIWQQVQSIEVARQRILRNGAEISNLKEKVEIERTRRAAERGVNAQLQRDIIDFGNRQALMTEEIGRIEAAQAAMDSLTELFEIENITKLITGVGVFNAAVQAGGEIGKANLEASKERLAATQDATIRQADDDILANNSSALIRTMLLEMNVLLIDSQEAAILLRQEAGRLTSLVGEKADLERRLAAVDGQLASRWFADPTHRLRALNATERAHISFRNSRKWLFFAARALEYKWNTPVNLPAEQATDNRDWKTTDLFKLRNALELQDFFLALRTWDTLVEPNRTYGAKDDWFSIREDYFGFGRFDDTTGEILFYDVENPATGQIENVDAITAFRYELTRALEDYDGDGSDDITLRFDTLRQAGYDTAANDGLGGYQSTLFNPDFYLDRIVNLRIFIRGPHQNLAPEDGDNTLLVDLSYLGTSVIRNEAAGQPLSPDRPDRVVGEFTSYPNRFYRFVTRPLGSPLASGYDFVEGLTASSVRALKVLPGRSRASLEPIAAPAPVTDFAERSVATSSWVLVLSPSSGTGPGTRLVISEIDDVELYIGHRSVAR